MTDHMCDILVIGGGIAGASIAAHLSEHARVHVLEMEEQPGYHSTGRSAALFSETYGNTAIRALTRASRSFLASPPPGFCSVPLLKPRPVLIIGQVGQQVAFDDAVRQAVPGTEVEALTVDQALGLCPVLRPEGLLGAVVDRGTADIEVHELHHGYLRALKRGGGGLSTAARVTDIQRDAKGWIVHSAVGTFRAAIIVNAAGAWAGEVGSLAGAQDIGLEPRRRTAALIEPPRDATSDHWPMVLDVEERFYMKPDAGLLLLSPADETLTAPCDAQPDEMDIAIAIDRLETATTLEVRRIRSKWAGLRSFVRDRSPVVGFDGLQPGFFWMAALGGYGIQTAPALSAMAADLVLGRWRDQGSAPFGLCADDISPARLR
ncbi:NAD(P)/FAD-dependent oxidoreductase [Nitrospirillum iridis]|uniref:D-arginine dehydrogenase n=1 Tax=Nitrospirillum iridis TaxID=765888 RepID=A0A7X0B0K3_9PROT|nr:FAD-binding oxidoreductase [Nitrospirillum iridis]MBB6252141.1 D-arginine dehydrogenase [Nitrospirillum iridis]